MCTVTVLPAALLGHPRRGIEVRLRLRIACNRDELTSRAPALPPVTQRLGERTAIMPIDPESGGTWIGANDAGIACVLLNVHADPPAGRPPSVLRARSRGTIIPTLLGCDSVDSALQQALALTADCYPPFRLLILDERTLVEGWNDDHVVHHRRQSLDEALIRTSSGLGDDLVGGPRAALFRRFLSAATDPIAAADLFHLHQWRGREELSVRMRRSGARTVSHTVVEIRESSVRLVYRPAGSPDRVAVTVAA